MDKNNALTDKVKYNSIDLVKFVMAICVIAIHTHPLEYFSNTVVLRIYYTFVNCAVPFFFLATGYLLAIKLQWPYDSESSIRQIKDYLVKIIKLYLLWSVIYLPLALWEYIHNKYLILFSILHYIRGLVLIGEHYNSYILWYLLSTIYTIILILIGLKRHLSPYIIFLGGGILLFISVGLDALVQWNGDFPVFIRQIKEIVSITILNGRILRGAFYIPCGMLLANRKLNIWINIVVLCIGFVAAYSVQSYLINILLTAVCSIALFQIVLAIKLKNSSLYPTLRKISTVMYFLHMYVWTFYYVITYGEKTYGADCFIYTTIISIIISYGYVYVKEKYLHYHSR